MKAFFIEDRRRYQRKERRLDSLTVGDRLEEERRRRREPGGNSNRGRTRQLPGGKRDMSQFGGLPVKLNGVDRVELPCYMAVEIADDDSRVFFFPKVGKINGRDLYDASIAPARLCRHRASARGRRRRHAA